MKVRVVHYGPYTPLANRTPFQHILKDFEDEIDVSASTPLAISTPLKHVLKDSEVEIDVNGKRIATYLLWSKKGIDSVLEYVFNECIPTVVGFDIGQSDTLYLCDEYTCIIIPLLYWKLIPKSLIKFLCWPGHTFVGVGIKGKMKMLERYGVRCRNAVELGPLAAELLGMPHLRTCGVDRIALEVLGFDLGRGIRLMSRLYKDSYGDFLLPTVNVSSCYQIGRKLLEERDAISAKRGRVIRWKNWLVRFGFHKSRFAVFVMIFLVFVGCIMNFDQFRKSKW